jgi:polar amino acid transport system substrate-binding protein
MKNPVTRTCLIGLCSFVFTASFGAHADALSDIKRANRIRVGIDLSIPPYGMLDSSMQPTGTEVELARKLANDLGVKLDLVSTTGASRIPFLQSNKADMIISTLSITPERSKVIDFSISYMPMQTIVFAPKELKIGSYADLIGRKVATSRGTAMDTQLSREAKGAEIVRFEDEATLLTAAVTGQAEIIGGTAAHLATVIDRAPEKSMERKFAMQSLAVGVGIRKGEPELLAWTNQWIKASLKDGSINAIYRKFLKADLPPETLAGAL